MSTSNWRIDQAEQAEAELIQSRVPETNTKMAMRATRPEYVGTIWLSLGFGINEEMNRLYQDLTRNRDFNALIALHQVHKVISGELARADQAQRVINSLVFGKPISHHDSIAMQDGWNPQAQAIKAVNQAEAAYSTCLLYTSPSPRD